MARATIAAMKALRLVACAFIATLQLIAADAPFYRIALEVSCSDQYFKSRVYSLVSREMRKLGDVEVVDSTAKPDYIFKIMGLKSKSAGGVEYGYALSTVLVGLSPRKFFDGMMEEYFDADLYVGAVEKIEERCAQIVASFDTDFLDARRKLTAKFKEGPGK